MFSNKKLALKINICNMNILAMLVPCNKLTFIWQTDFKVSSQVKRFISFLPNHIFFGGCKCNISWSVNHVLQHPPTRHEDEFYCH